MIFRFTITTSVTAPQLVLNYHFASYLLCTYVYICVHIYLSLALLGTGETVRVSLCCGEFGMRQCYARWLVCSQNHCFPHPKKTLKALIMANLVSRAVRCFPILFLLFRYALLVQYFPRPFSVFLIPSLHSSIKYHPCLTVL